MAAQVPEAAKIERLHRLQDLLDRQQTAFNSSCVGTVVPVLFERAGRHPGQLVGRSPYLQAVHAAADSSLLGRIVEVAIEAAGPNSLSGALLSAEAGFGLMPATRVCARVQVVNSQGTRFSRRPAT